jgi:site-specific recombinase
VWAALFARLAPVFPGPVDAVRTRNELLDALSVLTHRIAAGGLDPALVRIHPALDEYESPFMAQSAEAHAFIASEKRRAEGEEAELVDDRHLLVLLRQCDEVLLRIRKCAHATGATVGLTYKLQRLRDLIDRTRALLAIVTPTEEADARRLAAVRLFKELVRADAQRNDLAPFVARNTQLLAEQVTAHAGRTGEHYITTTRAEYAAMFRGAAGAGVLVGLAAHAKIVLQARHFAPLVQATLIGLTYVTAFIGVQLLGFTIATKQPAMTAAALAAAIDETAPGKHRLSELTEMVVRLVRSQLVAVVGNVVVAFPVALLVSLLVLRLTGAPAVTDEKAAHLLADHYPLKSMALPHAAIAGLWLFLAGLVAGYFDNAAVYHRLPERIAQAPKVRFVLGPRLAARLGRYLGRGLGALAGNASFGLLLGYTAFVGVILGLPIDIRHVSFASANLAITLHAHHFDVPARALAAVAGGIVLIGVINVAVSFTLSLLLAFHARRATVRDAGTLVANVARRFYGRPLDFVYPPADAPDPTPPEPVG